MSTLLSTIPGSESLVVCFCARISEQFSKKYVHRATCVFFCKYVFKEKLFNETFLLHVFGAQT